jgi:hypothetical protein
MKINELKVTALPQGSEVKGTAITNEPIMDLEFKTDIVAPEHTNSNPDYTQELAPEGVPQNAWNTMRDQHYAPEPESEWSNTPNKYTQRLLDLRQQGINWLKDKFTSEAVGDDLTRMRTLAGLMEKDEDVWAYSPQGSSDIVARVVKTDYGFQVYVRGPHGWIAQGQPHKSQEEAEADAHSFFEAIDTLDVDKLNEEQFLEVMSILELHDESLTEEQLNEILPAVAAGVGAGLGMWGIEQATKPKEKQTWYKLWKKFGPKKDEVAVKEGLPFAMAAGAAAIGAGTAGYKWLKDLKGKTKDQTDTRHTKIDQALKDSIDPQPWWNDVDSTLQEMKKDMLK